MDSSVAVKIYAVVRDQNEEKMLLKNSKGGLSFLQGKFKTYDPSSIFAATRILLKKLYNSSEEQSWDSELFQYWLVKFTEAHLVKQDNGGYSFIIEIPGHLLQYENNKLQLISASDLQSNYSKLHQEYNAITKDVQEVLQFYATTERAKNHYAILNCEADPAWSNYYEALYIGYLKNKGETWTTYKVYENEFPSEEELIKIKGVVIGGSEWSVYDTTIAAIPIFLEKLRNLVRHHPDIKIVGVCFGCQSLATIFGGRVEKMKLENKPMLMNREKLNLLNGFAEKYANKLKLQQFNVKNLESLYIVECHGDNVVALPEGATLYATSERTPVEVFGMGDNILAFQGHPEFNASIMLDKVFPDMREEIPNYDEVFEDSRKSLLGGGYDQNLMASIMENFLKEHY